jgi:lipoprotein-releasing system permease protein
VNFPFYIAKRYVFSKSKSNAINIISLIALLGVIVGTISLFVVLSVFSGLRDYSVQFTNDFDPDLKIFPKTGKSFFINENQKKQLDKNNSINFYSKVIEERVLFSYNNKEQVTYLKGVDQSFTKSNKFSKNLFNGIWFKPNTTQAVIGYGISQKLSLGLLDYNNALLVYVPKPGKGQIESEDQAFNKEYLITTGIYAVSEELDSKFVFVDLGLAQSLFGFKQNQVSAVEITCKNQEDKEKLRTELLSIFNNTVSIKTREELNETLHKMLNTENFIVYLIFTLVLIVALFNLIGALIMIIIEKKQNLITLKNLGAETHQIKNIFLFQGITLSFFGGIFGLLLGILIVFLQQQYSIVMITENLAYPVVFEWVNIIIVMSTIVVLGVIASIIASSRINNEYLN